MKKSIYFALILGSLLLAGCKPTEKNYKAAYDAAVAKREKANSDGVLPADGLLQDDGPRKQKIAGEDLYVLNERTNPLNAENEVKKYSVAVAVFKMPTNAKSGAESLRGRGYKAFAVRARGDRYYIFAGSFDNEAEAKECYLKFKKDFPDYSYIGLPDSPVVVRL